MQWAKFGCVYDASFNITNSFLTSHASNPTAIWLYDDVYRVFFSARDANNRSSVASLDINIITKVILRFPTVPDFIFDDASSLYSHGVSIGCAYLSSGKRYMLFMGWQNKPGCHWMGEIGRLIIDDQIALHLDSHDGFLLLDSEDPISLSYPWVIKTDDGRFKMWYGSTITWDAGNAEMLHVIKAATSRDGHKWEKTGVAIPYELGKFQAFSRPTVIRIADEYHMWFSYRSGGGQSYRIGHAVSEDSDIWRVTLDDCCLDVSESGWDSEMVEYPFVFEHNSRIFMLYNGNSYGKTGFGLAELVS